MSYYVVWDVTVFRPSPGPLHILRGNAWLLLLWLVFFKAHDGDDPSLSSTFLMLNCFHPAPQVSRVCQSALLCKTVRMQAITRCSTIMFFSFDLSPLVSLNAITTISTATNLFSPTHSLITPDQTQILLQSHSWCITEFNSSTHSYRCGPQSDCVFLFVLNSRCGQSFGNLEYLKN